MHTILPLIIRVPLLHIAGAVSAASPVSHSPSGVSPTALLAPAPVYPAPVAKPAAASAPVSATANTTAVLLSRGRKFDGVGYTQLTVSELPGGHVRVTGVPVRQPEHKLKLSMSVKEVGAASGAPVSSRAELASALSALIDKLAVIDGLLVVSTHPITTPASASESSAEPTGLMSPSLVGKLLATADRDVQGVGAATVSALELPGGFVRLSLTPVDGTSAPYRISLGKVEVAAKAAEGGGKHDGLAAACEALLPRLAVVDGQLVISPGGCLLVTLSHVSSANFVTVSCLCLIP